VNEIPRSMIQLAHEKGAEIEVLWQETWGCTQITCDNPLPTDRQYRIANKTADGLRLDELLDRAEWNHKNIATAGTVGSDHPVLVASLFNWVGNRSHYRIKQLSLVKRSRPMTAQEIAMLPRGTAFIGDNGMKFYSPRTSECTSGVARIHGVDVELWEGYTLPGETGLRKFEVVDD